MDSDLQRLKALEQLLGKTSESMPFADVNKSLYGSIRYALDDEKNVIALGLSSFGLTEIPSIIFQFKNLRGLQLYTNNLRELPRELASLSQLEILSANFNRLSSLPPELGQLQNLRILNVRGGKV